MNEGLFDLYADYHTHTHYSHGTGTVLDNVRAARARGLRAVAISDHGPANLFGVGVEHLDVFWHIRADIKEARARFPDIQVLLGVEANVVSDEGELDIPRSMQDLFDIVLVGLHPLVRWRPMHRGLSLLTHNILGSWLGDKQEARRRNTRAIVAAVRRNRVHIVTHPGYRMSIDTEQLAAACAETGCAMEISGSHAHTTESFLRIAREAGATFAIGSDAHTPDRVGDFRRAVLLAAAADIGPEHIVNVRQKVKTS